jgi:RNA polymerase sigma-70 factor (ECF subfamily)
MFFTKLFFYLDATFQKIQCLLIRTLQNLETVYIDKHVELVNECRTGNRKAQFELYKLYANAMYNVALRIVNDDAEAEDVLQEAFLDAFNRIADFRQETTFGLWLKQIVINRSINYLRKRKVELVSLEEIEIADEPIYDESETILKVEAIKAAMNELPDGYRVVLTLYLFEGYDHEEISHILKITENTSRSQYMRAKRKLNSLLETKGVVR